MAEYIDKRAFNDAIREAVRKYPNTFYNGLEVARKIAHDMDAADVVPVVRCKECQNSYEWANVDGDNYRYCGYLRDRWNHDYDRMVDDDDFCKWGRKMDGGRP